MHLTRARAHLSATVTTTLPFERAAVDPALGRQAHVRAREHAVEPRSLGDELGAAHAARAEPHQHRADAAARPRARKRGRGQVERGQPPLERCHLRRGGALLRSEDRRRPLGSEQGVAHVEGGHDLGVCGGGAERLLQAGAAVGARRAADADDDPPRAGGHGGGDQLAGAERARRERVGRQICDRLAAAGLGHVERRLAACKEREPGRSRAAQRVTDGRRAPLAAARVQERLGRALAAVCERHQHDVVARPHAAPAPAQRRGRLGGGIGARELVRRDHEPHDCPLPRISILAIGDARYIWEPSAEVVERARVTAFMREHGIAGWRELIARSQDDIEWFWDAVVRHLGIEFQTPYTQVLDASRGPAWPRWFIGGEINLTHNCVDRHARTAPDRPAVVWESEDGARRRRAPMRSSRPR